MASDGTGTSEYRITSRTLTTTADSIHLAQLISAASKVFGTTELLEHILENFTDKPHQLFRIQRVNRAFHDVIKGSIKIQRIMGLRQQSTCKVDVHALINMMPRLLARTLGNFGIATPIFLKMEFIFPHDDGPYLGNFTFYPWKDYQYHRDRLAKFRLYKYGTPSSPGSVKAINAEGIEAEVSRVVWEFDHVVLTTSRQDFASTGSSRLSRSTKKTKSIGSWRDIMPVPVSARTEIIACVLGDVDYVPYTVHADAALTLGKWLFM